MEVTILYHNPDCSKSRAALDWLRSRGIEPEIVDYLREPPSPPAIEFLLARLPAEPRDIMRREEARYQELALDDPSLSRRELVATLCANPELLQRPILLYRNDAIIARPLERLKRWIEGFS